MIVILGDVFRDRDVFVSARRENPERTGQRIWTIHDQQNLPGGAGLLAAILRRLMEGQTAIRVLSPILDQHAPRKTRYWDVETGELYGRADQPDVPYDAALWVVCVQAQLDLLNGADALIYCDYGRGASGLAVRTWLAAHLRDGLPIYSTARDWPETRAWWWVLNEQELLTVQPQATETAWTEHQWMIETRGKDGSWVSQVRQGQPRYVQDVRVRIAQETVRSVVGAGDAYLAKLIHTGGDVVAAQRFAEEFVQMDRRTLKGWLQETEGLTKGVLT